MSVAVSLEGLGEQLARFGSWPYAVTVSTDGRPHAVSVEMAWDGSVFQGTAGRGTLANAGARPDAVTFLWPPYEPGGYSLIVDGTADLGTGDLIAVHPVRAVLHRVASASPDLPSCIKLEPTD